VLNKFQLRIQHAKKKYALQTQISNSVAKKGEKTEFDKSEKYCQFNPIPLQHRP